MFQGPPLRAWRPSAISDEAAHVANPVTVGLDWCSTISPMLFHETVGLLVEGFFHETVGLLVGFFSAHVSLFQG